MTEDEYRVSEEDEYHNMRVNESDTRLTLGSWDHAWYLPVRVNGRKLQERDDSLPHVRYVDQAH
jgi:hypothetical protein